MSTLVSTSEWDGISLRLQRLRAFPQFVDKNFGCAKRTANFFNFYVLDRQKLIFVQLMSTVEH